MRLTREQVETFNEDGYLFFERLFSAEEVAVLEASMSTVACAATSGLMREKESDAVRMVHGPHLINQTIARLSQHPRLVVPAEQLLGSRVYTFQSRLVVKSSLHERPYEGFPWHQDFSTWYLLDGMKEPRALVIAIFLDEVTPCNAPLMLVPKSHRRGMLPRTEGEESEEYRQIIINPETLSELVQHGGIKALLGPPGSTLFMHCNLVHASTENISPLRRAFYYVIYNSVENPCGEMTRQEHHAARDFTPITPLDEDCLTGGAGE